MNDDTQNNVVNPHDLTGVSGSVASDLTPSQAKRLPKWGVTFQPMLKRAWKGKCPPRTAIKLMCLDCVGEDKQAVADCGDRCCPIWMFRPYQKNRKI